MPQNLKQFKAKHPFTSLLLVAIAVRILAVILLPGYGSNHDIQQDCLIQGFFDWIKHFDWVKSKMDGDMSWVIMILSRAFYATVSIFTVLMVYRICDLLANDKAKAWNIALIPTVCVIMPSFGIIDNVSFFLGLPVLLFGSNMVLRQQVLLDAKQNDKVHRTSYFIAGLMLGLSACIWYQSVFAFIAILLMLSVKRDLKGALITMLGFVIIIVLLFVLLFVLKQNPWDYIHFVK